MLNFLGIGAQKCGTTWLYAMLKNHPQLAFPDKEIHFWDRQSYPPSPTAIDSYAKLFDIAGKRNGEITPAYAFLPIPMIQAVQNFSPNVRLFYIMRDPVARAWSSALMALDRAEMTIAEASDAWFIDHFNSAGSRARGDYAACLDNWLSVFPREQLLLLQYENITLAPKQLLDQLCQHIGIDAAPILNNPKLKERVFEGSGHAIRPQLKEHLETLYSEPKQRLKDRYGICY